MLQNPPFPCHLNKPLSTLSTLGIGGPARYVTAAHTIEEMQERLSYAFKSALPVCILGKGSNALFDDKGYDGLVILNKIDYLKEERGVFTVGAGYSFAHLGKITARKGWKGLEFACGIPATVGGAIFMNAAASGQSTSDTLIAVKYVTHTGNLVHLEAQECSFGYRTSSFQAQKGAIVEGVFALQYAEGVKQKSQETLRYRLKTQPYKEKSAGCAFRNPEGGFAGKLIEECGFKGYMRGGAQVSELHANFIINRGGAQASDVLELIREIQISVHQKTGILLETEIQYIYV